MGQIRDFRDLRVYQRSLVEAQRIFEVTRGFPQEERYALTDQIRRSSRAVGAMLAEAWARRRYPAAFANKVNEALGEAKETQAWLDHALNCAYIDNDLHTDLDTAWTAIGGMLHRMIQRTDTFTTTAP